MSSRTEIEQRLAALREEHRDLDEAVSVMADSSTGDRLALARMKKRRLRLRDEIRRLESLLYPDIIA